MSVLDVEYEFIDIVFLRSSESGKTSVWGVYTKRGDELGQIRWFGRWRQYVFFPANSTVYSAGCLVDIVDFIKTRT